MIVTIDGPAGAGKSTVARRLAERLGYRFLDTGAMYRAVALAAVRQGTDLDDPRALGHLSRHIEIELDDDRVMLDGEDVTTKIRTSEITTATQAVAQASDVREHLVQLQRRFAEGRDVVTEGRDQGTVVFPDAEFKFFVTASPEVRARRRLRDLEERGERPSLEQVLEEQNERDRKDATRQVGPLVKAEDAEEILTDGLNADQVVDQLVARIRGEGE